MDAVHIRSSLLRFPALEAQVAAGCAARTQSLPAIAQPKQAPASRRRTRSEANLESEFDTIVATPPPSR